MVTSFLYRAAASFIPVHNLLKWSPVTALAWSLLCHCVTARIKFKPLVLTNSKPPRAQNQIIYIISGLAVSMSPVQ